MARFVLAMLLACAVAGVGHATPVKGQGDGAHNYRQGGTGWDDAVVIPNPLPYSDSGATCGNSWVIDFTCGYTAGISPDTFYSYTACADMNLSVSLCGSTFDTELSLFDSNHNSLYCDDDFCTFQSEIDNMALTNGAQYFIVVSGYYGACGSYVISVTTTTQCSAPPQGTCCAADGSCTMTTQADCTGTWTSGGSCTPNPCPQPVPTKENTWGAIKQLYH